MHRLFSAAPTGATGVSLRSRAAATAVALLLALQPLGPGVAQTTQAPRLPDLGDESEAGVTPAQERKLGESVVAQIRASGGYLDDPEVNDYLNELGNRLVSAGADRFDFEFFAVPDPSINAFALPGGFIGVNTGLVLLAQSESELASVLAHEITHVTQRHYTRSLAGQQRSLLYSLAALAVAIAASRSGSSSAGQATSRGRRLGAGAGDPDATQLHARARVRGRPHRLPAAGAGGLRSDQHGDVHGSAAEVQPFRRRQRAVLPAHAPDHLRAHRRGAGASVRRALPAGRATRSTSTSCARCCAATRAPTARPSQYFRRGTGRGQVQQRVADPLRPRRRAAARQGRRRARSRSSRRSKTMAPPHPMIDGDGRARADGVRRLPRGARAGSSRRSRSTRTRCSSSTTTPTRWSKAGRGADAAAFVEAQLARFPGNGPLHRSPRRPTRTLGPDDAAAPAPGRVLRLAGNLRAAVLQLELALKAGDGDFYQYSVVETRLRTLRRELAEQQAAMAKNG